MDQPAVQDKADLAKAGVVAGRADGESESHEAQGASAVVAGGLREEELQMPTVKEVVTRRELWAYYVYYIGNSGLSL